MLNQYILREVSFMEFSRSMMQDSDMLKVNQPYNCLQKVDVNKFSLGNKREDTGKLYV